MMNYNGHFIIYNEKEKTLKIYKGKQTIMTFTGEDPERKDELYELAYSFIDEVLCNFTIKQ